MIGAGESGKSTVLKQMKLIYAQGFSKNEKLEWKPVVFNNIIQSFRLIFEAMNELGLKLDSEDNEVSLRVAFIVLGREATCAPLYHSYTHGCVTDGPR
jgi:hypothetical protein